MKHILKITSPVILLIAILISIAIGIAKPVDQTVYNMLHTYLNADIIKRYLYFVSVIFDPKICLILTICVLAGLFFYHKFKFLWYGFWCFSVFLIGTFMKYVIQRPRPTTYFEGYSFPSMHVLSVCILVSLILLIKRNKILYCIAIILVASIIISRIYVGAHYFTDTMGSLLVISVMIQSLNYNSHVSGKLDKIE
ncbi:phosphatase PAP2 family protein [Staphylococcus ureilyticus]|uniref:phosphatase PAP2 family protein n=1 Tax=Staphylococcus TaxID=1279 RepID=UPI0008A21655|nr:MULTISPECIES: phosphatase PAP2 family protein [Staphylococcus]PIS62522.1 phospholipid phosphatase [Corynebacterium striatum]MDK7753010.1 phosphatase PAP2 family protein [Staphylococcus sp. UMB10092B]MDT3982714.1 phosphatase PAP2 family protein [Staphylococcus ureilyticus]OFQ92517.1 phospholipid phosphatase [Staphylococcus sp. HMSC065A08]OHO39237.1 phospholipid phosphatase [Staphylococcus sp. HMSC034G07]